MRKVLYALALLVLSGGSVLAQQLPQFSHYGFNGMYISPGYAGITNKTEFTAIYRYQWAGYETSFDGNSGQPQTGLFSASIPISALKGGIGVHFATDELGATDMLNGGLSYAYHLNVGQGKLGIGVQGNFTNISKGEYRAIDPSDPRIPFNSSDSKFDVGAGLWYQSDKFYAGLGTSNLLQAKYEFETADENSNQKASVTGERHAYFTAGYNIPVSYTVTVTPTAIVKTDLNETNFEVGARALFNDKFWGGLGYRHQDAVTALAGIGFLKDNNMRLGYAFDLVTFDSDAKARTSHEIMLSYRLPKTGLPVKPAIKTPRYSF
ncbi:MAG: type IX secretion system membrane protein PorP/SprF [Hymenobacteraceae bacterium]|nr:type IX secretion system membrane protein PorP/SprF [Hymenobacteraceae bacterium]MDX5394689.1 type IX secretion system membrane protein PorP/SprF [Hymenobacteraceae bacterium]MDX5443278.1 type IX secretion system membrane protein PorP/SprF [Hymenobacteraceae bacterium]MDX5510720.1 type IX secretion system membrane protein PorP/SprF [Hymenobacteraceae bacterium]